MPKAKTVPAAAKADVENQPFVLVKDEQGKMKHLTTLDVPLGEVEDREPSLPNRGPQTGDSQMSNADYLKVHATKEELAVFRAAVQARMARTKEVGWRVLPSGMKIRADLVLAGCSKCGRWEWTKSERATINCLACNFQGRVGGGKLRPATAGETELWLAREKASWDKFKADKPKRDAEIAAADKRRIQDGR
jgi:hypothetical protein